MLSILEILGMIFLIASGIGYLFLNIAIIGILEIIGFLFTGFFGFIIIGLIINVLLSKWNGRN